MRLGRAIGDHVLGEALARKAWRLHRIRLGFRELLTIHLRGRRRPILDGEERFARPAVEHEDITGLGDLRDCFHGPAVPRDGDKTRRGGEIQVPDIVPHVLEMPDPPARARVQRQYTIGKQVVADSVGAVEIEGGRPSRGEHHAELRVDA